MHNVNLRAVVSPSRYLHLLVSSVLVLAIIAIWVTPLSLLVRTALLLVCGLAAFGYWRQSRMAINAIVYDKAGWGFVDVAGKTHYAPVRGDSLVTPSLAIVRFQLSRWRTRSVVLLPDAVAADDFRQLRVLLKTRFAPATG